MNEQTTIGGYPQAQQTPQRSQLHVEFYEKAVLDKKATEKAGRIVHKSLEYVRIRFPGDRLRVVDAPAHERTMMHPDQPGVRLNFIDRFPEHYRVFKDEHASKVIGTPLEVAPFLTAGNCADLKAQNVHTLEQLASVPDNALPSLGMGSRNWRNAASDYIAQAARSADTSKLAAENDEMKDRIAQLEEILAQMNASTDAPRAAEMAVPDAGGDDLPDLGPGTDFENWDLEALRAFLADAGQEQSKSCGRPILVRKARELVMERRKKQTEAA